MRELTFSRFSSATDSAAKPETRAWSEWLPILLEHEQRGTPDDATDRAALERAKNGPALVFGKLAPGAPHTNAAVEEVHAIALDIEDAPSDAISLALEALAPYEFALATTHKHGSPVAHTDPDRRTRLRVVLPLREPATPKEHRALWERVNALVGGIADRKTKNVGRLFYLPSTYDRGVALAYRNEGAWLALESGEEVEQGAKPTKGPTLSLVPSISEQADRARIALRRMPADLPHKAAARAVLKGKPLAAEGGRHEAILGLTIWLAHRLVDEPVSTDAIVEVFAASANAMHAADPVAPGLPAVVAAWEGAVAKVDAWRDEREKEYQKERKERAIAHQQATLAPGVSSYTEEDLENIARAARIEFAPGQATSALHKRWLIQTGEANYFVLQSDGNYRGPHGPNQARLAAVELLARAPVMLNEPTKNGMRRRLITELAEQYGTSAVELIADLSIERSWFDARTGKFFEAVRPRNVTLGPVYDAQIDQWLRVLAGPAYDKICDWLACAPDTTKPLCAVYFSESPSTGKSLLAEGIAKIWSETPCALDNALSSFNSDIARCPLVFADETTSSSTFRQDGVLDALRKLISAQERTLTRKYAAPCALRGCIRLIIAANNLNLLKSRASLTAEDLEAIALRFLHVPTDSAAADFLRTISDARKDHWRARGIAEHALWLSVNRTVVRGRRFWVEGDTGKMHRALTIQNDWSARVCEWLTRFLLSPQLYANRDDGRVRAGSGALLVNEQAIVDGWKLYFPDTRVEPETAKIATALRAISEPQRRQLRWKGSHVRYRVVRVETLIDWAETSGIGDRISLTRALWEGNPPREPGEDDAPVERVTDDLDSIPTINTAADAF